MLVFKIWTTLLFKSGTILVFNVGAMLLFNVETLLLFNVGTILIRNIGLMFGNNVGPGSYKSNTGTWLLSNTGTMWHSNIGTMFHYYRWYVIHSSICYWYRQCYFFISFINWSHTSLTLYNFNFCLKGYILIYRIGDVVLVHCIWLLYCSPIFCGHVLGFVFNK